MRRYRRFGAGSIIEDAASGEKENERKPSFEIEEGGCRMLKKCLLVSPWLCLSAIIIIGVPLAFREDKSVNDPIQTDPVAVVAHRGSYARNLEQAFERLRKDKAPPPSWWADFISDQTYPGDHREHCLVEYFRRHVMTPITVEKFGRMPGMRDWFSEDTVSESPGFGTVGPPPPISGPKSGELQLKFYPMFDQQPRRVHVLLNVSLKAQREGIGGRNTPGVVEFLELLRGKRSDSAVQITEIGYWLPWEHPSPFLGN